jgi:Na+/H+-translocating membrane pyrophosphatase
MRKDTGTPKMQEIAKSIQQGANGFLRTQYLTIAVMSVKKYIQPGSHTDRNHGSNTRMRIIEK